MTIDPRPDWDRLDAATQKAYVTYVRAIMQRDGFGASLINTMTGHQCAGLAVVLGAGVNINDLPGNLQRFCLRVAFAAKVAGII